MLTPEKKAALLVVVVPWTVPSAGNDASNFLED